MVGGYPTVGAGIVSPAGVEIHTGTSVSTPDDHFTASPHCRVMSRAAGALVVLVAVQLSVLGLYLPPVFEVAVRVSAPDDHFTASPDCRVTARAAGALVVLVAVQLSVLGLYLPPVFKYAAAIITAPDDHFSCRSRLRCDRPASGRVGGAGGCPTIRARIVSPAGVQQSIAAVISTPDDHFTAGPHCRVIRIGQLARWSCWWLSNYPCWDCISRRCSE